MCGGPTQQQKQAAATTTDLAKEQAAQYKKYSALTDPFYASVLSGGLPYFGQEAQYGTSDIAKQINQARANYLGRMAGYGDALPSGFAEAGERDISESGAQAFDQNMMNLMQQNFLAKMGAAQALNPFQAAGGATSAGQAVMQAPLQNNFWSNVVGGALGAAGNIFKMQV